MRALTRRKFLFTLLILMTFTVLFLMTSSNTFLDKSRDKIYKYINPDEFETINDLESELKLNESEGIKYILQWSQADYVPFVYMIGGQQGFISRKCPHKNCFFTSNKNLQDVTKYDAISFSGPTLLSDNISLPTKRSPHQKYVFSTMESSDNYPICNNKFDGFFNWTWTYRLDSEINLGYFSIWDKNGNIVGPKIDMEWIRYEDMDPVSKEFKEQLKSKKIAAAWFASNCNTRSKREDLVKELQKKLEKYKLAVDVYGSCGNKECSRNNEDQCFQLVKEKYYFYLAFENSINKDYVTEKVLTAMWNDAVPVVYGGANYSRFLPPGSYLDAKKLGVKKLASKMNRLIQNPDEYAEYFRWKKYYSYHQKFQYKGAKEYCLICSLLNNREKLEEQSAYEEFAAWWNPPGRC